ncbi:MAG: tRNA (adenosine(37)-N6)-threonylcarbamoyltransferase complex ATPase subunit type 1 TsaE [Pseudobdellovibrio sp.]
MKSIFSRTFESEFVLQASMKSIMSLLEKDSIILMSGVLSAGKTTFVSLFCKEFGLNYAQSPTYAIHQRYSNEAVSVDHFDLYRLETSDEVESSGFFDLLNNSADYKFIEWSERINLQDLPVGKSIYKILIEKTGDTSRKIEIFKA